MTPPARKHLPAARLVLENVSPCVDAGRYPAKRLLGETLSVGADIYKDGHDAIAGRLRYRAPGQRSWRESPLVYHYDPDRWEDAVTLDRLGRWQYSVEAWPDPWETWRSDLRKRVAADQEVEGELLEGAALLRRAAKGLRGRDCAAIDRAAAFLDDAGTGVDERVRWVLSDAAAGLVPGPIEPDELTSSPSYELVVDRDRAGFAAWYELFPRSQSNVPGRHGTFSDVARRLPELAELGFDVVYLPPIHPIGRTKRKGPDNNPQSGPGDPGSPWAIGSEEGGHTAVHPKLGSIEDFEALVERAAELGMEIALDYALQCSPDHPWAREHPEWFHVRRDGTIRYAENPPKKYEDIVPLNFWCEDREALWQACRDVLLFWIDRGVRIFRVDNPHTKPLAFWEWCIREVQEQYPDAIFLAEAFTRPKRMKGLAKLGFTQSYSYFTWKNEAWELREYLEELAGSEMAEYYRPNFFANTPDILHEYLQRGGRPAFRVRLLLAATLSPLYGIYSGFELCENLPVRPGSEEYLHSEKYELRQRDWNAPGNLKAEIRLLNRLRRQHPALQRFDNLRFLESENERILAYWKSAPGDALLVAVNLDPTAGQETMLHLQLSELGLAPGEPYQVEDLLDGSRYTWTGERNYVRLDPERAPGHLLRIQKGGARQP